MQSSFGKLPPRATKFRKAQSSVRYIFFSLQETFAQWCCTCCTMLIIWSSAAAILVEAVEPLDQLSNDGLREGRRPQPG